MAKSHIIRLPILSDLKLKRANIEQIKDFFSTILEKINYDENGQPNLVLEKIKKIPKFDLKGLEFN